VTSYAALQFDLKTLAGRLQELKHQGFIFVEDALPADYCEAIAGFIDTHLDEKNGEHESGHIGTVQRIWSAEKYSAIVQDYKDKCSRILSTLFGQPLQPQKNLAVRGIRLSPSKRKKNETFLPRAAGTTTHGPTSTRFSSF
jgi:hypothetical protein